MRSAARDDGLDVTTEPPGRALAEPASVIAEVRAVIARWEDGPEAGRLLARLGVVARLACANAAALSAAYARGFADGQKAAAQQRRALRAVPAQGTGRRPR